MESSLGVKAPSSSQIMIVASPVGPYYPAGFVPVKLYCETDAIRAAPGGTGHFKLGANYGPTILPGKLAEDKGYN